MNLRPKIADLLSDRYACHDEVITPRKICLDQDPKTKTIVPD